MMKAIKMHRSVLIQSYVNDSEIFTGYAENLNWFLKPLCQPENINFDHLWNQI